MAKLRFLLSLITSDNDYQQEQALAAKETAHALGVELTIIYADSDSVTQSQQLLQAIQAKKEDRPDGILFEPAGTGLEQVAKAAVGAGIGWVVINRDVPYTADLRRDTVVPLFSITTDNEEVGRIQGRQIAKFLPDHGTALYMQGPSTSDTARLRTSGIHETKPKNLQLRMLRGQWTESSGHKAVASWLELSTSREAHIELVTAQNDVMAMGARKAFEDAAGIDREKWLGLPFLGCDGCRATGQVWVNRGFLAATVQTLPLAGKALEMMVNAFRKGNRPPERTVVAPHSYPEIESISLKKRAVPSY